MNLPVRVMSSCQCRSRMAGCRSAEIKGHVLMKSWWGRGVGRLLSWGG